MTRTARYLALLVSAVVVIALGDGAHAQAFPKGGAKGKAPSPIPKGLPPIGPTTPKKSRLLEDRYDPDAGTVGRDLLLAAGDRVTGEIAAGAMHTLRLEAVEGAKLTVRLVSANSRLPINARVRDPLSNVIATLDSTAGAAGTYEAKDIPLDRTGLYAIELAAAKSEVARFELSTRVETPTRVDEVLGFDGGRPTIHEFGGMRGRSIDSLRVWSTSRDGLILVARLTDPDGIDVDLTPYLTVSPSGDMLTLTPIPIEVLGRYRLTLGERSRGKGTAKLQMRFSNPPAGRARHRL